MERLRWDVENKTIRIEFKVWFSDLLHDHSKYLFSSSRVQEINDAFQNNKSCFMKIENVADFRRQSWFLPQRIEILATYMYWYDIFQFGPTASGLVSQLERKHRNFRSICASVLLQSCFKSLFFFSFRFKMKTVDHRFWKRSLCVAWPYSLVFNCASYMVENAFFNFTFVPSMFFALW